MHNAFHTNILSFNKYSNKHRSIFKRYLVLLFVLVNIKAASQEGVINGYIRDSLTHFPVAKATVSNVTNKLSVVTDDKGFFRLKASLNDELFVQAKSYQFNTWKYSSLSADTITIFLSSSDHRLLDVTVTSQYDKYQSDSVDRRKAFDESMGRRVKTVSKANDLGFGIAINLDRFKKKHKYQKRDERVFDSLEEMAYVNYRFSPNLVAYYTKLKGDALKQFLYKYTPSYTWLRQHPNRGDIILYINDAFKLYKASPGRSLL